MTLTFDLWLMPVVVLHPHTKFEVRRPCHSEDMAHCVSALMGLVTLTFDLLTSNLVCKSHLRWGTFLLNLGTIGLWILELFAMYATDGQTNGRTDKSNAYCPLPYGRGIINNDNDVDDDDNDYDDDGWLVCV